MNTWTRIDQHPHPRAAIGHPGRGALLTPTGVEAVTGTITGVHMGTLTWRHLDGRTRTAPGVTRVSIDGRDVDPATTQVQAPEPETDEFAHRGPRTAAAIAAALSLALGLAGVVAAW